MRNLFLTFLLTTLLFGTQGGFAQDEELPIITVFNTSATYAMESENNYTLTFRWEPATGAQRYSVQFGYKLDEEAGLPESRAVEGDSTSITIPLTNNYCYVQVIGFDDVGQPIARSAVYSASLSLDEDAGSGSKFDFVFLEAFGKSFVDMDPIAGWTIVAGILFLLFYGIYMLIFINKEVRYQDFLVNTSLKEKVDSIYGRWCNFNLDQAIKKKVESLVAEKWARLTDAEHDSLKADALEGMPKRDIENLMRDELDALKKEQLRKQIITEEKFDDKDNLKKIAQAALAEIKDECGECKDSRYSILRIFEAGLENHIANYGRENTSQEVDRDMEKAIYGEIENLKIGNHGSKNKHLSLNRIKMFAETAPMLGLLGTVSGLIVAFFNILQESSAESSGYESLLSELSGGIYSAIVTTIIGLIVGIILLFLHHSAEGKIRRLQNTWENLYREISRHIA